MNLVIVESPAKAKTINKYLGSDYTVLASYGHIRDLPSKNGSVDPENDFKMIWEVDSFSKKYLKEITDSAKDSKKIILATDPDREGEAIAWHVKEFLEEKKLLKDKEVERVVFNEITKKAVTNGIDNPRKIEPHLVDAYMARRALDYLVGFNISPILWTKLPGSKSAGRVQSVALRLLTEREQEIEVFQPKEFWTLNIFLLSSELIVIVFLSNFADCICDDKDLDHIKLYSLYWSVLKYFFISSGFRIISVGRIASWASCAFLAFLPL